MNHNFKAKAEVDEDVVQDVVEAGQILSQLPRTRTHAHAGTSGTNIDSFVAIIALLL